MVTPHQTVLLKLLDSYLHGPRIPEPLTLEQRRELCKMLVTIFFCLTSYTQHAISQALGPKHTRSTPVDVAADPLVNRPSSPTNYEENIVDTDTPLPMGELDLLLPKVCEALVLVTQCLTSLTLQSEEVKISASQGRLAAEPEDLKLYVSDARSISDVGFVESLIGELLFFPSFQAHADRPD